MTSSVRSWQRRSRQVALIIAALGAGLIFLACGTAAPQEEPGNLPAQVMSGRPQEEEPMARPKPTETPSPTTAFNPVHCDYLTQPRCRLNPGPSIILSEGYYSPPPPIDIPMTPIPEYLRVGSLKVELIIQGCLEFGIITGADAEELLSDREDRFGILKQATHRAKLRAQAAAAQDPAEREAILESLPPYPDPMLPFEISTAPNHSQSIASWIEANRGRVTSVWIGPEPTSYLAFGTLVIQDGIIHADVPWSAALAMSQLEGVINARNLSYEEFPTPRVDFGPSKPPPDWPGWDLCRPKDFPPD